MGSMKGDQKSQTHTNRRASPDPPPQDVRVFPAGVLQNQEVSRVWVHFLSPPFYFTQDHNVLNPNPDLSLIPTRPDTELRVLSPSPTVTGPNSA